MEIKEKKEKDDREALRKAKKKLATAVNRAKN
jgi:ribosomal protein L16/L10AE